MLSQKPVQTNWIIWIQWVILTSAIKFIATTGAIILLPSNWYPSLSPNTLNLLWVLSLFTYGVLIAAAQWLLLRRYFLGAAKWIAVGGVGMALAGFVPFPLKLHDLYVGPSGFQLDELAYGFAFGFLMGLAQWFVMRDWFENAGWWVLSSTMGWAIGMTVGELLPLNWNSAYAGLVYGVVTEGIPAAITGLALVLLLQNHLKPKRILNKNAG